MSIIITILIAAAILLFFEVIVPGGILGAAAAMLVLIATVMTYNQYGGFEAMAVFGGSLIVGLGMILFELWLIRKTPLGRAFRLQLTQKAKSNVPSAEDATIVGELGEALTTMAPSGKVRIGQRSYEAASRSGMLNKGEPVRVVAVESFRILVEKAEDS